MVFIYSHERNGTGNPRCWAGRGGGWVGQGIECWTSYFGTGWRISRRSRSGFECCSDALHFFHGGSLWNQNFYVKEDLVHKYVERPNITASQNRKQAIKDSTPKVDSYPVGWGWSIGMFSKRLFLELRFRPFDFVLIIWRKPTSIFNVQWYVTHSYLQWDVYDRTSATPLSCSLISPAAFSPPLLLSPPSTGTPWVLACSLFFAKWNFAAAHPTFVNPIPGCMTVRQMQATITITPSRIMNWTSLLARWPLKPPESSTDRKTVRTKRQAVARPSAENY